MGTDKRRRAHGAVSKGRGEPGLARGQAGLTLLETLLSLALVGIIFGGLIGALTTSSRATIVTDELTTGDSLAEAQMEYVRSQVYDSVNDPPQYSVMANVPSGYTVICTATRLDPEGDGTADDDGLQKVVVTVQRGGRTVATLEAYKVR